MRTNCTTAIPRFSHVLPAHSIHTSRRPVLFVHVSQTRSIRTRFADPLYSHTFRGPVLFAHVSRTCSIRTRFADLLYLCNCYDTLRSGLNAWHRLNEYSPHIPIPFDHEVRNLRTRRTIEGGFAGVRGSVTVGPWSTQMTYCPHCGQCDGATSCTALESCLLSTTRPQFSHCKAMSEPSTIRVVSYTDRLPPFKSFTASPDDNALLTGPPQGCTRTGCETTSGLVAGWLRLFRRPFLQL